MHAYLYVQQYMHAYYLVIIVLKIFQPFKWLQNAYYFFNSILTIFSLLVKLKYEFFVLINSSKKVLKKLEILLKKVIIMQYSCPKFTLRKINYSIFGSFCFYL
eukprot:TRINITY_DN8395_c0_g1_i1.p13 TRINITY_DN8395_c0_g1~~TRINITY_DN8395_c0_g1_i1.p13  ORF type:complete len:103 (-),score=1.68 TRINITY_DN8395_c0_g1_i1:732-1040(-)